MSDRPAIVPSPHRHSSGGQSYPLGTIIRCDCGKIIRYEQFEYDIGSGGYAWFALSRWQLWLKRRELAAAGLTSASEQHR